MIPSSLKPSESRTLAQSMIYITEQVYLYYLLQENITRVHVDFYNYKYEHIYQFAIYI